MSHPEFFRTYMMLLANVNQAANAEERGFWACEGGFSITQLMTRVGYSAADVNV